MKQIYNISDVCIFCQNLLIVYNYGQNVLRTTVQKELKGRPQENKVPANQVEIWNKRIPQKYQKITAKDFIREKHFSVKEIVRDKSPNVTP